MVNYWPPLRDYELGNLTDLDAPAMLNVILGIALGAGSAGPVGPPGHGLWMNLVRLTDQAIREHAIASGELANWEAQGQDFGAFLRAVDALEQCIVASHRAMLMANALIDRRLGRGAQRPPPVWQEHVRLMRHAIEHTDDRLTGRRPPVILPGQPTMLSPTSRYIQLGPQRLAYRELTGCIRSCHRIIEIIRAAR
jgi:hypothetical protein